MRYLFLELSDVVGVFVFFKNMSFCNYIIVVSFLFLCGCAGGPSKKEKNSADSMIRIAQKARNAGNSEAAVNFYNRALKINPSSWRAYLGLAEVYIDTNLLDGALEYIKKADELGAPASRSFYLKGKIALLRGDSKTAERLFLKSGSIDALNGLGALYDDREDHQRAQELYKKVIEKDPNYIDAYNNMGLSLLLSGKYQQAIFYLENACSLPESDVTYRSNLALAYGLSGDISKARTVYSQDFEGDELEEKVAYVEDLLASRQRQSVGSVIGYESGKRN